MLGMLFGMLTRPHAVGPDGIRVRNGPEVDIALPWADIESVVARKHVVQEKQPKVIVDDNGHATLHLRMQNETNIEVKLARPVTVRLPRARDGQPGQPVRRRPEGLHGRGAAAPPTVTGG